MTRRRRSRRWSAGNTSRIADFSHLRHGARLHRADAAMGIPGFHQRGGARLSRLHASNELRGDRRDDGRRPHHRRHHRRRRRHLAREAGDRRRRAPLGAARGGGAAARRSRRADGCLLVPRAQAARRREPHDRRLRTGRIIALIDRGDYWQCAFVFAKGSAETIRARGIDAFRADVVAVAPMLGRRDRGGGELGRRQAADGRARPADALASPGAAGDRRCRPCDVAGRRGRDQSRHPGCGGGGQYPRRPACPGRGRRRAARPGPGAAHAADAADPGDAARGTDARSSAGCWRAAPRSPAPPRLLRLLQRFPRLQRIPAWVVGLGFRREHIRSPEAPPR